MKWINFRELLLTCSILGAIAVGLGAFGAHSLKSVLPAEKLVTYNIGITYQFYHTIVLLFISILVYINPQLWFKRAAIFFVIGIVFFSGSLYLLAARDIIGLNNYKWIGPLTPIGGVLFILGWISLGIGAIKYKYPKAAK